ncbi:MAG TPA: DNA polymerase III subunit beta [Acidimicrobiia bacterium]|nr:DNA polymerase III subunit beta [Acidimicrobiia bacterium]
MKFRCERDTLADAISTAQRAVASRSGALPVLSGLRVTASGSDLELVGSDLELTIRVHAPAQSDDDGVAVVPARLFGDIVRALEPGPVDVHVHDDEAHITSGRSSFSLRVLAAEDFPRLADVGGAAVQVEAPALAEALRQVVPAASKDDARPILTGVLLTSASGGLRLVATDSYRLAVRDLQGVSMLEPGQRVLVAGKALSEVQRLLGDGTIDVTLADRDAKFGIGPAEVTTRLIEGEFPNYEQLIPSGYPNRLTVDREALGEAVRRVRLVGQGRDAAPIRLAMSTAGVELSAVAQEVGEAREMVEAKYEGGDLTAAFNAQFLLDGIESVTSSEVVVETVDALKPATLRATDGGDFLYLLMPVRIS